MSFTDIRDLSEHLKFLGFTNKFPLSTLYSNYGSLNGFKIVSDILQWLAERLEPGTCLPGGTKTENERVLLIRSATEFFVTKAGIKLNPRKLYGSTSAAAQELQKVTSLLLSEPPKEDEREEEISYKSLSQFDLGDKIDELRRARELSSELTNRGAALYDLLSKELVNKETRVLQASRPLEISTVESALKNAISSTQMKLQSAKKQLETSRIERNALSSKVQRKTAELERSKQRLEALQRIRPAYLEEFEQLEDEMRELFQQYFLRVRCRDALKSNINARTKFTTPVATPLIKPTDNSMTFIPEGLIDVDVDGEDDEDADDIDDDEHFRGYGNEELTEKVEDMLVRPRPTTGRLNTRNGTGIRRHHKTIGSMMGDDDGLDTTLGSDDSDSELDIVANVDGLLTDDDDDDLSLSKLTGEPSNKNVKKNAHSDEDF